MKNVLQEARLGIEPGHLTVQNNERICYMILTAQSQTSCFGKSIRSINKEKAKQDALRSADDTSAILIMDWAMKFLQIRYREKQSDWFG